MNETLLILDLGTTNIKALVFDARGRAVFECARPTPAVYGDGSVEIDADELWRTVAAVSREAARVAPAPAAVSMSTMAASFIPLDAAGRPLHPAIAWPDARSIPAMRRSMRAFLDGDWIPGCGQYPLQMYLPFKMEWFAGAHPAEAARTRKWLNVSEYVYAKLTGDDDYRTDYSIASRTMLFDIGAGGWNRAALSAFGVDETLLPKPVPAGTVVGTAGAELRALGIAAGTPIVMGGHDHMCAIPGAGILNSDVVLNTTGTSEGVVSLLPVPAGPPDRAVKAWLNHEAALDSGRVAVVGYVGASGRVYQSLRESVGLHPDGAGLPVPETAPVFLPPQRGQLTSVEGELRGLRPVFDGPTLYRAMLDGLYLECRRLVERIVRVKGGEAVSSVRVVGGHTKNAAEIRRKCSAMGLPVEIVTQSDISSLGAAVVAGAGCGLFSSFGEAVASLCREDIMRIEPDAALSRRFEELYRNRYLPCFEDGVESL